MPLPVEDRVIISHTADQPKVLNESQFNIYC